jgi:phosphoglycolate phosphatase
MPKYKLIVFDLDGTLLDTREGILKSIKETVNHYNLIEKSDDIIQNFIGPPIQNSLKEHYGLTGVGLQQATDYFRKVYSESNLLYARVYDGIYDLFKFLKDNGFLVSVATYKREDYALRLLKSFHFDHYSDILFGADNSNKLKKEDIIRKCIEKANIQDFSEVLMVGDTLHDYEGAKQIGIDFLAVTYGFGFKNKQECEDLNCIAIIDVPLEIISVLNSRR